MKRKRNRTIPRHEAHQIIHVDSQYIEDGRAMIAAYECETQALVGYEIPENLDRETCEELVMELRKKWPALRHVYLTPSTTCTAMIPTLTRARILYSISSSHQARPGKLELALKHACSYLRQRPQPPEVQA